MRIVIDINNSYKEYIDKIPYVINYLRAGVDFHKHILKTLQNGTPIPDNATNGDVIKTMFPNLQLYSDFAYWDVDLGDTHISVDKKWWNSPYKGGE